MKHLLILTLAALAACSTELIEREPWSDRTLSGDSQFYTHPAHWVQHVDRVAAEYCAGRGKTAYAVSHQVFNTDRMNSNYVCR